MRLSARSRYGLSACIQLAAQYECGCMSVSQLGDAVGVSEKFLEQIMSQLKKDNIVVSTRGAQGGYTLAQHPAEISVGMVLRALEDNLKMIECMGDSGCGNQASCPSYQVWDKLYSVINSSMDSISLAVLI